MAAPARTFSELQPALLPTTVQVIESLGFKTMTPVQSASLPLFLGNKDVCVEACTGSGKTLAYVIPIIERLAKLATPLSTNHIGALVLAPTRELAKQIHQIVSLFAGPTSLKALLLIGGTDVQTDLDACVSKGCNIVVATPGRVLDILRRCEGAAAGTVPEVKRLEVLVLDEADTLLDMGFHDALTEILGRLPKQRRTGLFSATQTQEVRALARAGLRNPAVVTVQVRGAAAPASEHARAGSSSSSSAGAAPSHGVQSTPLTLTNLHTVCEDSMVKLQALVGFLRDRAAAGHKCIVFVLTCASVDYLAKMFSLPEVRQAAGLPPASAFPILPLHGKQDPKKRSGVYSKFVEGSAGALLCTDVAARGIDVPDVDWILQYDPPQNPAFYVHRVGRTARAGRKGAALLLLLPKETSYVQLLAVRNVPLTEAPLPSDLADSTALARAVQSASLADRAVLETATRAFISFLRGYKEHDCKFIFRVEALDIPSLASSFGLVKLPKVDELRGRDIPFQGVPGVDTSAIAFKDPAREAQRQVRLAAEAEEQAAMRAARDARREAAQAAQAAAADPAAAKAKAPKRKRTHNSVSKQLAADWEALQKEEALEKRFRSGRMSKKEYKAALAELHRAQGIDPDEDDLLGVMVGQDGEDEDGEDGGEEGGSDDGEEDDEEEEAQQAPAKRHAGVNGKAQPGQGRR